MDPQATVDTVLNALLALAGAIITTFVIPLIVKQGHVADGKLDQQVRDTLYPGLTQALNYAAGQIRAGQDPVNLPLAVQSTEGQRIVSAAANYVEQHFPDALKWFDIQRGALERMLTARMGQSDPTPAAAAPAVAVAAAATKGA